MTKPIEAAGSTHRIISGEQANNSKPIAVDYFNPSEGWGKPIIVFDRQGREYFQIDIWDIDPGSQKIKIRIVPYDPDLNFYTADEYLLQEMGAGEAKPINVIYDLQNGLYDINHDSKLPNNEQGIMFPWSKEPIHFYIERINISGGTSHVKIAIEGPVARQPNTNPQNKLELKII